MSHDTCLINDLITIEIVNCESLLMDGCVVGQISESATSYELIQDFGRSLDTDIEEYAREVEQEIDLASALPCYRKGNLPSASHLILS